MGFSRKKVIVFLLVVFLMMPSIVTAFNHSEPMPGGGGASLSFDNPTPGVTTISGVLNNIVLFLLGLSAILALLAFVWGGIMYITAFGNDQRTEQAKKIVFWGVIGFGVIVLAYSIIRIVGNILGADMPN